MLPGEQETQEVARGDRLDLGAQTLDRVVVNAREQPPVAPLLGIGARGKPPAHGETFGLQRFERRVDLVRFQSQRSGEGDRRDRPQALEPSAQDLDQRGLAGPGLAIGQVDQRVRPRFGPQSLELRKPLRRDPDVRAAVPQTRDAVLSRERLQPLAPIRRLVGRQEAEPGEQIMQLVRVGGIGPRLGADARDRLRVEPADVASGLGVDPAPAP